MRTTSNKFHRPVSLYKHVIIYLRFNFPPDWPSIHSRNLITWNRYFPIQTTQNGRKAYLTKQHVIQINISNPRQPSSIRPLLNTIPIWGHHKSFRLFFNQTVDTTITRPLARSSPESLRISRNYTVTGQSKKI